MSADGFKNFRDLKKALGSGEGPEPETEGRGWSLEVEGEEQDPQAISGPDETARDRIDRRPAAYAPMDTGPPPYRDDRSDELRLLYSFRVRTVFPEDVRREVASLPQEPNPEDYAGRRDLRREILFTIDGEDAKDFDDAISIEELADDGLKVGVHIADVSHYVRPGTQLDAEAIARGTSVYLPDQVVPMLPEELSNGLCSLVPERDRCAYSVFMTFDKDGERTEAEVCKSVIRSARRNTYREVQALLDGPKSVDDIDVEPLRFLEKPLRLFERWTKRQQQIRDSKGSLRIQSKERKFVFDGKHEVEAVVEKDHYFSNTLIEETALAANQAVGDLFRSRGLPTIYRVHPEKDEEEIAAVSKMLAEHGIRVPKKDRLTGRDIGRLIRAARNKRNAEVLIQRIMGLVERAYYEVRDHEDVATHFGLVREAYLHFTSPIRRYPDLMVHRWLSAIETRGQEAEKELKADALIADLNDTAAHCSQQSEVAAMAQLAIEDLKICQYLEPHIGEKLEASIQRVSRYGMEVRLSDFNVDAFLPTKKIGERPQVKGPNLTVRAGRRTLSFSEGHPIRVRILDVDFLRLQVMLELA